MLRPIQKKGGSRFWLLRNKCGNPCITLVKHLLMAILSRCQCRIAPSVHAWAILKHNVPKKACDALFYFVAK